MSFLLDLIKRIEKNPPIYYGWEVKGKKRKLQTPGICPRCNFRQADSRDHVIPQVLGKMCQKYGIEMDVHYQSSKNIVLMCKKCNSKKGHKLENSKGSIYKNKLLMKHRAGEIYLTSSELRILRSM